jgi:hypothetical protein
MSTDVLEDMATARSSARRRLAGQQLVRVVAHAGLEHEDTRRSWDAVAKDEAGGHGEELGGERKDERTAACLAEVQAARRDVRNGSCGWRRLCKGSGMERLGLQG